MVFRRISPTGTKAQVGFVLLVAMIGAGMWSNDKRSMLGKLSWFRSICWYAFSDVWRYEFMTDDTEYNTFNIEQIMKAKLGPKEEFLIVSQIGTPEIYASEESNGRVTEPPSKVLATELRNLLTNLMIASHKRDAAKIEKKLEEQKATNSTGSEDSEEESTDGKESSKDEDSKSDSETDSKSDSDSKWDSESTNDDLDTIVNSALRTPSGDAVSWEELDLTNLKAVEEFFNSWLEQFLDTESLVDTESAETENGTNGGEKTKPEQTKVSLVLFQPLARLRDVQGSDWADGSTLNVQQHLGTSSSKDPEFLGQFLLTKLLLEKNLLKRVMYVESAANSINREENAMDRHLPGRLLIQAANEFGDVDGVVVPKSILLEPLLTADLRKHFPRWKAFVSTYWQLEPAAHSRVARVWISQMFQQGAFADDVISDRGDSSAGADGQPAAPASLADALSQGNEDMYKMLHESAEDNRRRREMLVNRGNGGIGDLRADAPAVTAEEVQESSEMKKADANGLAIHEVAGNAEAEKKCNAGDDKCFQDDEDDDGSLWTRSQKSITEIYTQAFANNGTLPTVSATRAKKGRKKSLIEFWKKCTDLVTKSLLLEPPAEEKVDELDAADEVVQEEQA